MPDEPGYIFSTFYDPDPGPDRPDDLYGEALFQQSIRLAEVARKAGITEAEKLFGPDGWGYPSGEAHWWEPAALLSLVDALETALTESSEEDAGSGEDSAVSAELNDLRAIVESATEQGFRIQVRFIEEEHYSG